MSYPWNYLAVIAVCILLIVGVFQCGAASDRGDLFGFDGWIVEPGCDLGNPNCEPEDIRESCRYPGDTRGEVILYNRYCK